jgi:hypothetical protein
MKLRKEGHLTRRRISMQPRPKKSIGTAKCWDAAAEMDLSGRPTPICPSPPIQKGKQDLRQTVRRGDSGLWWLVTKSEDGQKTHGGDLRRRWLGDWKREAYRKGSSLGRRRLSSGGQLRPRRRGRRASERRRQSGRRGRGIRGGDGTKQQMTAPRSNLVPLITGQGKKPKQIGRDVGLVRRNFWLGYGILALFGC